MLICSRLSRRKAHLRGACTAAAAAAPPTDISSLDSRLQGAQSSGVVSLTPLTAHLGAEVGGVDLRKLPVGAPGGPDSV